MKSVPNFLFAPYSRKTPFVLLFAYSKKGSRFRDRCRGRLLTPRPTESSSPRESRHVSAAELRDELPRPLQYTRRNRRREVQINRNVFIFHVSRPRAPTFSPRRLSTTGVVNLINQPAKLLTPTHAFSSSSSSFFRVEEFSRAPSTRQYVASLNLGNRERKFVSGILSFIFPVDGVDDEEEERDERIIIRVRNILRLGE